jgi:hypothetical protein
VLADTEDFVLCAIITVILTVWVRVLLWPKASRPVCLGIKHPSVDHDQIFITFRQLRVCWRGTCSLTRRRVCRLQLLLILASAVIFGSESRGTRDHMLLSQIGDFFSSPPTTRRVTLEVFDPVSSRDILESVIICSYDWWISNKSTHQSKPRLLVTNERDNLKE